MVWRVGRHNRSDEPDRRRKSVLAGRVELGEGEDEDKVGRGPESGRLHAFEPRDETDGTPTPVMGEKAVERVDEDQATQAQPGGGRKRRQGHAVDHEEIGGLPLDQGSEVFAGPEVCEHREDGKDPAETGTLRD